MVVFMAKSLNADDFLQAPGVLLDVRSPGEYAEGHVPGAVSFPLFSDEERARVGICYKHQGRDEAVELGFAIAGPKFADFIARAKILAPDRLLRIYCWRGGMRSAGVAWVLEMGGFKVSLLVGGYKAFRRWGRSLFSVTKKIILLGGMTGSRKTEILSVLAEMGEQVLDLEGLANHRGSSYGALMLPPQPTNEQFWNLIAMEWRKFEPDRPLWIEGESKRIGVCRIPEEIFLQMERAPVVEVVRSREERVEAIVDVYGQADIKELIAATERIRKRLGGLRTTEAVSLLQEGKLGEAFDVVLHYYDKTYSYDLEKRHTSLDKIDVSGRSVLEAAELLRQFVRQETFQSSRWG